MLAFVQGHLTQHQRPMPGAQIFCTIRARERLFSSGSITFCAAASHKTAYGDDADKLCCIVVEPHACILLFERRVAQSLNKDARGLRTTHNIHIDINWVASWRDCGRCSPMFICLFTTGNDAQRPATCSSTSRVAAPSCTIAFRVIT